MLIWIRPKVSYPGNSLEKDALAVGVIPASPEIASTVF